MKRQSPFELDDRFLRQVYRLSVALGAVGVPVVWGVYDAPAGLSFMIGSLFSVSAILSLEFVIRRMIKPDSSPKTKRWLGFVMLGKYTIFFGVFYVLMKTNWLNVYALAAGIGVVQIVIVFKAVQMMTAILLKGNTGKHNGL